jgi:hypothetical protein
MAGQALAEARPGALAYQAMAALAASPPHPPAATHPPRHPQPTLIRHARTKGTR